MLAVVQGTIEELKRLVGELEPDRFDGSGARAMVEAFGEVERLGAAGKALAARQVVATGSWKQVGSHRDAADWLASATGATVGAARATTPRPRIRMRRWRCSRARSTTGCAGCAMCVRG